MDLQIDRIQRSDARSCLLLRFIVGRREVVISGASRAVQWRWIENVELVI
jgi:hypothetical protein